MADFNLNVKSQVNDELANEQTSIIEEKTSSTESKSIPVEEVIRGLNKEELNDPNKINVTIADKNAPLVILFGPPSCGKTMTLVRLTRYLKGEGYKISPIKSFRPSHDYNYKNICDNYDNMINQSDAAQSTDRINFMLVEIIKNGKRLCQILEAPGEFYFNPGHPTAKFPNYVNTIINCNNRKIWCIMVEPDWENECDRNNYVSRIHNLKQKMRPTDKTIFVFNKIDLTNFVISPGHINLPQATKEVANLYPGIYAPFRNMNPITRFFSEWRCDFVPFQTGDFTESNTTMTYQEGPHEYPSKLWNTILKRING
ncbi:hypothetical protein SAMN05444405_1182 [Bacteroides luti]|uniref:Uncharacterized protein n=1 Tax=Bacteroides luti TaxID=1297750 RepID=A0A1M5FUD5_9BACE|nr:hypothetical protein [Bacteroides luti]SHF95039.1 hypothetical protein SAMN05444405_1182 [Bacteroides luti]